MDKINKNIIIATGGTGGHILPAVSLVNYLNKIGFNLFLTTDRRGLKFIDTSGINNLKIINGSSINKKNIFIAPLLIFVAVLKSFFYLLKVKPKFIFGMGGYASFPVCAAAIILKIPFILYENNLQLGKANRILLPFAKKIFISYKEIIGIKDKYSNKTDVIGNIIREQILDNYNPKENDSFNTLKILVLGGSQAAKIFAEFLPKIFVKCKKENIDIKIFQQCLPNQVANLKKIYEENNVKCELFSFTFNIIKFYEMSNLVITRSGSSALAELLNCKLPIITIPLKSSAENHQLKNAKYFVSKGYAIMIEENDIENELFQLLKSINKNNEILNTLKENQTKYSDKRVFVSIKEKITKLFYEN